MHQSRRSLSLGATLARAALRAPDFNSVDGLASVTRLSVRTLQRRCHAAGITAKAAVDFVRCLHMVLDTAAPWDPAAHLAIFTNDTRTIDRILRRAALERRTRPALDTFLASQRLIESVAVLGEVGAAVSDGVRAAA